MTQGECVTTPYYCFAPFTIDYLFGRTDLRVCVCRCVPPVFLRVTVLHWFENYHLGISIV